ncbi:MAG: substrate-binding periplasmic protein [Gammaproteobacteria bacterium]
MRNTFLLACALALSSASAAGAELRLLTAELPPYTFHVPPPTVSEYGEPTGVVYDVVREMARRVGHSGAIEFLPWTRAQELARQGPRTGILSITRTPEREPHYTWVARILTDDLVLVGGAGVDVSDLAKVKDRPVGVLRGSGAEQFLRERSFTRVEPASEEWINAQKMKDRLIDAWLAPRLMVLYGYREVGGDVAILNIGQIVRRSEIWLAASKDVTDAEAEPWRKALEAMQSDGSYERIMARYSQMRPRTIPGELRRPSDEIRW